MVSFIRKYVLPFCLIFCFIIALSACNYVGKTSPDTNVLFDTDSPEDVSKIGTSSPETFVVPFESIIDISDSFTEGEAFFDESLEKQSLMCKDLENGQYDASKEIFLPDAYQKMVLQSTWVRSAKTVYIGFLNLDTNDVYAVSFVGGSITGTVNLDCLPDGNYQVLLYGSDNEQTFSILIYQFQ